MLLLLLNIIATVWLIACLTCSYLLYRFMKGATQGFVLALLDAKEALDD